MWPAEARPSRRARTQQRPPPASYDLRHRSRRSSPESSASHSFPISRTSKAEFILPVAMGSPENYYGVFGRSATRRSRARPPGTTRLSDPATAPCRARSGRRPERRRTPRLRRQPVCGQRLERLAQPGELQLHDRRRRRSRPARDHRRDPGLLRRGTAHRQRYDDDRTASSVRRSPGTRERRAPTWSTSHSAPLTTTKGGCTHRRQRVEPDAWGGHGGPQGDFTNTNFQLRLTWNPTTCSRLTRPARWTASPST